MNFNMDKQLIICIGREYGSGGHEIGEKLAKKLDLPLYDRNLLDEVAATKNVDVNEISAYDEKPRNFLFSRTVRGYNNSPEQNVAEMQFALLKSKAADGDSFVIVGRCSDELFEGLAPYLSIFIHGDEEARIERIMKVRNLDRKKAKQAIERHDRKRRQYHNNFCQKKWGESKSYHLCINSSRLGIDACVDLLADYISKLNK
jgi:cytidylate kinase